MQKDDEVGKVAQATPIVICTYHPLCLFPSLPFSYTSPSVPAALIFVRLSMDCRTDEVRLAKALELFLSKLVEDTAKVSVGRGAKRMEAYHL
jgi:Dr1-associated corepressor